MDIRSKSTRRVVPWGSRRTWTFRGKYDVAFLSLTLPTMWDLTTNVSSSQVKSHCKEWKEWRGSDKEDRTQRRYIGHRTGTAGRNYA